MVDWKFWFFAALLVLDLVVLDPLPVVDEVVLAYFTAKYAGVMK